MSVLLLHFSVQSPFLMLSIPLFNLLPFQLSLSPYGLSLLFYWGHLFTCYYVCPILFVFIFFLVLFTFTGQLFLQCFRLFSFPLFCSVFFFFSRSSYFPHVNTFLTKHSQLMLSTCQQAERYRLPLILFPNHSC